MTYASDLQLTQAIAAGDPAAWNMFVRRYGDMLLAASVNWCESGCRVPRSQYDCILRSMQVDRPEPAERRDTCREGLLLYHHVYEALKPHLARYQGESSLGGFLRLALREVRADYLERARGRFLLPQALAAQPALVQDVYRLGCREASRAVIAARLGASEADVRDAERAVRDALRREGKEWWTLGSWGKGPAEGGTAGYAGAACDRAEDVAALVERKLSSEAEDAVRSHVTGCAACQGRQAFLEEARNQGMAPEVASPAWINRDVLDHAQSAAPEPEKAGDSWGRKIFSQPSWLLGLVVGGLAAGVIFTVLIPRQEYAGVVKEPSDQLLARAERPLEPGLAARVVAARDLLARGKIDAAIQNLDTVLSSRPENQEARWLLASTYDRLGDRPRAARQYRIYVSVAERATNTTEDRVVRARGRLEAWDAGP